ncbi:MAG: glycosyltransferase [Thiolinea sp.]
MPDSAETAATGVVYVITSLAMGGAQNVLLQLLEGCPGGFEPLCVVTLRCEPGVEDKVKALGLAVFHLELNKPWLLPLKLWQLRHFLRGRQVGVLSSIMPHANLFAPLLQLVCGRRWPVVWNLHNTPDSGLYSRRDHRFIMWLSYWAAKLIPQKIIVVSERSRARYLELGYPQEKLVLIGNGVPVEVDDASHAAAVRAQLRAGLGLESESILIGSLTRYVPAKNIPLLLEAFKLFSEQCAAVGHVPVYLLLAGENMAESNAELQQLVVWYQLEGSVLLLGIRDDAPRLIRALDIATLSSVSEALPLFMVEAMAAGVPCVATDVGDIARLFGDSGWLVESGQAGKLADAWHEVLSLPKGQKLENIRRARQRIVREYGVGQMLENYARVFSVLNNG